MGVSGQRTRRACAVGEKSGGGTQLTRELCAFLAACGGGARGSVGSGARVGGGGDFWGADAPWGGGGCERGGRGRVGRALGRVRGCGAAVWDGVGRAGRETREGAAGGGAWAESA